MRIGLALLGLLTALMPVSAQEGASEPLTLHVGFTLCGFRTVNVNDATAAFRVFALNLAHRRGYKLLSLDTRVFEDPAECEAEIKKGAINLAILDTWDYLGMDIQAVMPPVAVHLERGTPLREYLLLTRRGGEVTGLADLRGKDLAVLDGKGGDLSRAWLDHLLLGQRLGPKESFFRKLDFVAKPTAAVLPVFFGSKAACLVDRGAFQVMSELNPQVGQQLAILAASDPYLESITCVGRSGWPSEGARQALIDSITTLHVEPAGRQILDMFKVDQIAPFKDEYLDSVRQLRAASQRSAKPHLAALPAAKTGGTP
jgi:phosphonate transport system substrate-binding protein